MVQLTPCNYQVFAISCLVASCLAAPAADAEADPQYLLGAPAVAPVAPVAYHAATNCETVVETLITQTCTPTAENVCTTQTVETEEIEYEKVCKEVVDVICDGPAHYIAKREADAEAEADPQFLAAPYHHAAYAAAPVAAHAVAHSLKATVKHACREVTTEHCVSRHHLSLLFSSLYFDILLSPQVDNPKVKPVPVEVEHCHTVTKVTCADVTNEIPTTKCEPVVSEHVSHAAYAAPYVYGK